MCLQFCINLWGCVSCFRSGCRVCLHRTKNNNVSRCLELFKQGKKDFLRRYVTMDETWIYTPETKRSSAEWTAAGESRPKRPKTQQWSGKVMASSSKCKGGWQSLSSLAIVIYRSCIFTLPFIRANSWILNGLLHVWQWYDYHFLPWF